MRYTVARSKHCDYAKQVFVMCQRFGLYLGNRASDRHQILKTTPPEGTVYETDAISIFIKCGMWSLFCKSGHNCEFHPYRCHALLNRPCFTFHSHSKTVWALPLSTWTRTHSYYVPLKISLYTHPCLCGSGPTLPIHPPLPYT